MLYRKIKKRIEEYLSSDSDRMLLIDGARQIGKSYIIRHVGKKSVCMVQTVATFTAKIKDKLPQK